ncbi:MAG: pentapeptide repeat-containing protein, partial [Bacilli bacterium]
MNTLRMHEVGESFTALKIDCSSCVGLCCVAFYFSKSDGFPYDKVAGERCVHLKQDHRCEIHSELHARGLKGCTSYDCFGAGQKVTHLTSESALEGKTGCDTMFMKFNIARQLHEMLWYLNDALTFTNDQQSRNHLAELIGSMEEYANAPAPDLDLVALRARVNTQLKEVRQEVERRVTNHTRTGKSNFKPRRDKDYSGKNLRALSLVGVDFSGAWLMETNFAEADLTGANVIGADFR